MVVASACLYPLGALVWQAVAGLGGSEDPIGFRPSIGLLGETVGWAVLIGSLSVVIAWPGAWLSRGWRAWWTPVLVVPVLLLGMKLPPNYGEDYTTGFEQLFARVAADTGVAFVPFFLDGVAADPELNLPDGLHPNTAGHRVLAENLVPALRPLLEELTAGGAAD